MQTDPMEATRPTAPVATPCVILRPLDRVRPTELVDAEYCILLANRVLADGFWRAPITVEARTGLIMDGNHRFHVARRLGLSAIPCLEFDYADPGVEVVHWMTGAPFDKASFLALAQTGDLLPYKTTRHRFSRPLPGSRVPLAHLR